MQEPCTPVKNASNCGNCAQPGHMAKKCEAACGHCGKLGHQRNACLHDAFTSTFLRRRYITLKLRADEDERCMAEEGIKFRMTNPPEEITEAIVREIVNRLDKRTTLACSKYLGQNYGGDLVFVQHLALILDKSLSLDAKLTRLEEMGVPGCRDYVSALPASSMLKALITEKFLAESKAFTSDGPCSFGPDKKFARLYFLDMRMWRDPVNPVLRLWEVNLSHDSGQWKSLMMNKTQTLTDKADKGNRPHICFESIREQLERTAPDRIKRIYEGTFEDIFEL